jgi:molecular chaperone GrpE
MAEQSELKDARERDGRADEDGGGAGATASALRPDDSGKAVGDNAQPDLSPAYVAGLEARARAAEQKVRDVQSRFEELREGLQRQTDETRQRLNRAADERALGAKTEFVAALLPVLDNLQRSLETALAGGSTEALLHGLERTTKGFESSLASIGVEPVRSVGELFDPSVHEAVDTVAVRDDADGVVTREYSRGYKLGERLLRPSRVQVGRAVAPPRREREDSLPRRFFL